MNIGVVNLINSLPTLTPINFKNESVLPRYFFVMYANFIPCKTSLIIIATIAPINGKRPIARISSIWISN